MDKKKRTRIPDEIAAEILFLSDRTCCVCTQRGKEVQIHHIDENPSNNDIKNLAVLCFDCHNDTMINGGFGRKLNAAQVQKFREDWLIRVKKRKEDADKLASIETVTGSTKTVIHNDNEQYQYSKYKLVTDNDILSIYLENILQIHDKLLESSQEKWDSGVTAIMVQGNIDIINFYEEVLVELCSFYPKGHFDNKTPNTYITEIVSSKYLWHRLVLETDGLGTGGTIISTMVGGNVMEDLKAMIAQMAGALSFDNGIDFLTWKKKWMK
jgi:hypothetical protein